MANIIPRFYRMQSEFDEPTLSPSSEVYYNPDTMEYRTLHQDRQIKELNEKLENKEKKQKKELSNLIGYFYTSRTK